MAGTLSPPTGVRRVARVLAGTQTTRGAGRHIDSPMKKVIEACSMAHWSGALDTWTRDSGWSATDQGVQHRSAGTCPSETGKHRHRRVARAEVRQHADDSSKKHSRYQDEG